MNRYVPFEKLSKKKKRELSARQRGGWGELNPVTRKPPNPKAYNRKKAGRETEDSRDLPLFFQFTRIARTALSSAKSATPTSAKIANQMEVTPKKASTMITSLIPSAKTMF